MVRSSPVEKAGRENSSRQPPEGRANPSKAAKECERELPMPRHRGRVAVKVMIHAGVVALLYIAFSFALFLGLQVRPLYGDICLGVTAVLAAAYVYFGFIRRR